MVLRRQATSDSRAVARCSGATIQLAKDRPLPSITATSKRLNGVGNRPARRFASQLRVKLGMIRPPMSIMSRMVAAMPMRVP